jgi:dynein heavy chain
VDKVQGVLDECLQMSSAIIGSRFVKRLQVRANSVQDGLNLIVDTLEQWRECQRNWLYLENIFSSPDIRRQRPRDHADFEVINKNWNKLMKPLSARSNLLKFFAKDVG